MWQSRIAALQMMTGCVGCSLLIRRQTSTPAEWAGSGRARPRRTAPGSRKTRLPRTVGRFDDLEALASQELGDQAAKDMFVLDQQELPCSFPIHGLLLIERESILVPLDPKSGWRSAVAARSGSAAWSYQNNTRWLGILPLAAGPVHSNSRIANLNADRRLDPVGRRFKIQPIRFTDHLPERSAATERLGLQ